MREAPLSNSIGTKTFFSFTCMVKGFPELPLGVNIAYSSSSESSWVTSSFTILDKKWFCYEVFFCLVSCLFFNRHILAMCPLLLQLWQSESFKQQIVDEYLPSHLWHGLVVVKPLTSILISIWYSEFFGPFLAASRAWVMSKPLWMWDLSLRVISFECLRDLHHRLTYHLVSLDECLVVIVFG